MNSIVLNLCIFLCIILFNACSHEDKGAKEANSCIENLAAFDIGSGTTKLKVVEVDKCKKTILKTLSYMTMPISYAQDLNENNGSFSKSIQDYGTKVIERYVRAAKHFNAKKVLGVATSAFRKSSNGKELINKWNKLFDTEFRVIDQKEEAIIGYDSVRLHDSQSYAVWDIGGGSMQIVENTDGRPFIYLGNIASVTFKNKLIEKLKIKKTTPNPMNRAMFDSAINLSMELFNEEIRADKIKPFANGIKFVGIGGLHKSLLPEGKKFYTLSDMEKRAAFYIGKNDKEINNKYSDTMVSNIALIIGFMKLFKINRVDVENVVLSDGLIYQELVY